jgi:hypothetical protein
MNKNKVSAWIAIAILSSIVYFATANWVTAFYCAFILAALLTPLTGSNVTLAGLNDVDPALATNTLLDFTLRAFKRALMPITAFSTKFNDVQIKRGKNVEVPYYPLVTAASKDFDTCYVFDDD